MVDVRGIKPVAHSISRGWESPPLAAQVFAPGGLGESTTDGQAMVAGHYSVGISFRMATPELVPMRSAPAVIIAIASA